MGRFNIVNMSVFPNLIYRMNAITTKIPAEYSVDIAKLFLKFVQKAKDRE